MGCGRMKFLKLVLDGFSVVHPPSREDIVVLRSKNCWTSVESLLLIDIVLNGLKRYSNQVLTVLSIVNMAR